ncbi:MAG: DNA polymerase III subunit alpha, partial [Candidatus Cloacimonetes bacterium]|nr:DNA polymerase III subunit alpha [Candidatus Cloacimonadota bacterium]
DFCARGRGTVIDYIVEKYGRESVSQIVTFGTLGARSVIKDVARTLEVPAVEANKITKLIPGDPKITLEKALSESSDFRNKMNESDILRRVLQYSMVLEGLIRQIGIHAAGVLIGSGALSDHVPLAISKQKGSVPMVVVQFEGKWLEDIKMLKMDILGLKTLTIIKEALRLIKRYKKEDIDIANVDLEDKETYELLSRGDTGGVFQFESRGMKKHLQALKPTKFEDTIAMVALYRPGPMDFIPSYIARKNGEEPVTYDHDLTKSVLEETYGVTVYQEQVMLISKQMAGFSEADAGVLRKAISKKDEKMMAKMYDQFMSGSMKNGVPEHTVEKIWRGWKDFANYAFNKSHAACYAFIAFQTAFLKAHYPVEFMTAILSIEDDPARIPFFIQECKKMGIEVHPPNINNSEDEFTVVGNCIQFGLRGIKNVGDAAISAIMDVRHQHGEFKSIFDFADRVDTAVVNKAVLESLILSGTMDTLEGNRKQKIEVIDVALDNSQSERCKGQLDLFDEFGSGEDMQGMHPVLPGIDELPFSELLEMEKKMLGFYLSGHPLQRYRTLLKLFANTDTKKFDPQKHRGIIKTAGIVNSKKKRKTRRGKELFVYELEDIYGKFEMTLFNDKHEAFINKLEIGKEYFLIGSQSQFDRDESNMMRLVPQSVYTMAEVEQLSGYLELELKEEMVNGLFAERCLEVFHKHPGNLSLRFVVKTAKFNKLYLAPKALKVAPTNDVLEILDPVMTTRKPQVTLDSEEAH